MEEETREWSKQRRREGKFRGTMIETGLGPGCVTAGIPVVHRTRRHLAQAKQLGAWESARTKSWMQNERPGGEEGGRAERERRSGCLYELSQDVGNAAMVN